MSEAMLSPDVTGCISPHWIYRGYREVCVAVVCVTRWTEIHHAAPVMGRAILHGVGAMISLTSNM